MIIGKLFESKIMDALPPLLELEVNSIRVLLVLQIIQNLHRRDNHEQWCSFILTRYSCSITLYFFSLPGFFEIFKRAVKAGVIMKLCCRILSSLSQFANAEQIDTALKFGVLDLFNDIYPTKFSNVSIRQGYLAKRSLTMIRIWNFTFRASNPHQAFRSDIFDRLVKFNVLRSDQKRALERFRKGKFACGFFNV